MMSKDRITANQSKKKVPGINDFRHFLALRENLKFRPMLRSLFNRCE